MVNITRKGARRLDVEMSGRLNSEQMARVLDELVEKSEGIKNGRMLYDVIDFHLPSLGAIVVEFSHLPSMLGWIKKFKKAAVLTDKKWLKAISELEGLLYPGLSIKGFTRKQRDEAEAWLAD